MKTLREFMAQLDEHDMRYRAGVADRAPHWYCSCGEWRFQAKAMPSRKTGNNLLEAERSHTRHATA